MVGSRVYVGGLPYGVRERDLERFFKGYGRTRDILIKNGYGFVVSNNLIIIFIYSHFVSTIDIWIWTINEIFRVHFLQMIFADSYMH